MSAFRISNFEGKKLEKIPRNTQARAPQQTAGSVYRPNRADPGHHGGEDVLVIVELVAHGQRCPH